MNTILKVNNITKTYNKGQQPSLDKVSFNVSEGEFIGIMGASGSGKTTLLNVLSTIDKPTSGDIFINNINLKSLNDTCAADFRKDNLGFIFQEYFLLDSLTIFENISVPLTLQKLNPDKIENMVKSLAERFGIASQLNKYPNELSGGEQQMLAMGRALMSTPKLLLLDEPSMGLAPIFIQEIFDIIQDIQKQGTTVLLIEQNANKALAIADRGYVLETGKVVLTGTGKELLASEEVRKAYLGG